MARPGKVASSIGPLGRPSLDASHNELREHFVTAGAVFAMLNHEDALHSCLVCGLLGENVNGKDKNPGGRNRFCGDECEAVFDAYIAGLIKPKAVEEPSGKKKRRVQVHDEEAEIGEGEERSTGDAPEEP